ncbi:hypothetical protein EEB14_30680 [Rhodococcus sp. WS4]|nr:hypothetical protein EEB14_30680 [Rhodococcus sp. WS4]
MGTTFRGPSPWPHITRAIRVRRCVVLRQRGDRMRRSGRSHRSFPIARRSGYRGSSSMPGSKFRMFCPCCLPPFIRVHHGYSSGPM